MTKACSVQECYTKSHAKGYCLQHYMRFKRHGDPLGSAVRSSFEARFLAKVDKSGDCWEWTAAKEPAGYGMFSIARCQSRRAHRISYELFVGPIPDGLVIDHLCRNKGCVNPEHLEPVTGGENSRRGLSGVLKPPTTHCVHGHEYTPENTRVVRRVDYITKTCRVCASIRNDRAREARQERALLERAA